MTRQNPTPDEVTEALVERVQEAAVGNGACAEEAPTGDVRPIWNPRCGRANRQTLHYHLEALFKKFNETLLELREKVKSQQEEISELKNQNVRLRAQQEKQS